MRCTGTMSVARTPRLSLDDLMPRQPLGPIDIVEALFRKDAPREQESQRLYFSRTLHLAERRISANGRSQFEGYNEGFVFFPKGRKSEQYAATAHRRVTSTCSASIVSLVAE